MIEIKESEMVQSNGFINIRLSVEYLIISDTFNIDEYIKIQFFFKIFKILVN
jgi:hypothetical protein